MLDFTNQQHEVVVFNCAKCGKQNILPRKDAGGYYAMYGGRFCMPCRPVLHQFASHPEMVPNGKR